MSNSPPKDPELDPEAQSGEEEHMDKDRHDVQGHQGEFEVKEQDRWLPIANGKSHLLAFGLFVPICAYLAFALMLVSPAFLILYKLPGSFHLKFI
jgi:hypothetical protein